MTKQSIKSVLFVILFILVITQVVWSSNHRVQSGIVWDVNNNLVTVRLNDGQMYSYYTDNTPTRFDKVRVIFDTQCTIETTDDRVVRVY